MRDLKLREVKGLAQGHTARKGWTPVCLTLYVPFFQPHRAKMSGAWQSWADVESYPGPAFSLFLLPVFSAASLWLPYSPLTSPPLHLSEHNQCPQSDGTVWDGFLEGRGRD